MPPTDNDPQAGNRETTPTPPGNDPHPRRQRSSIPSFIFISFVLFMLTNNHGEEVALRSQYIEALESLKYQLGNYSRWLNGTESNFTLPEEDPTSTPLINSFITFGSEIDPKRGSYYSNFTGFWRGDLQTYNLTSLPSSKDPIPEWYHHAHDFIAGANLTNTTEVAERLGSWNWTGSTRLALSVGDKLVWSEKLYPNVSKDIAMIHGKIDFTDPNSSDEFRLDFDGVHFLTNGSIYAFAEPTGRLLDIRDTSSIVPEAHMNETARLIEAELSSRITKLKEKIDSGALDSDDDSDGPKSGCSFQFFGQTNPTNVPQHLMKELEDEIDTPTGISTVSRPPMRMDGILMSKNCGLLFQLKDVKGLKSQRLYRKITTYAGLSTLVNFALLALLTRQISRSRSAAGLARVSRYPFLAQSLIDAVSFVGHITLAILADGRPSVATLAPAGLACILFVYEAQFSVLIGQIQAPEDAQAPPPSPPPAPVTRQPPPTQDVDETTPLRRSVDAPTLPTVAPAPAPPPNPPTPQQQGLLRFMWNHLRSDPSARLWTIISLFLLVVFRLVIVLSLPLFFVGSMYAFMWFPQIYRAVRRGRTSGLKAEYLVGVTLCRLYFLLYFLACPRNVLDVDPRSWVWFVVAFMFFQVAVLLLQEVLGPTFFLPGQMATIQTYNYHPPMPLPDPEAPEQSLGDCAICMDAIVVDRSHRDEKSEGSLLGKGALWTQGARKSYSLAPCHHLFHTECLERWLAIKNICPQCRRPLPPL